MDGDTAVSGSGQRRHGSELKSPNPIREKGQKKGKWRGREQVGVLVRTLTTRERRQRGMAPASLEAWHQDHGHDGHCERGERERKFCETPPPSQII